ncbi:MAG: ABC transporter ATP-binding protein [Bacillota bacterium]
MIIIKSSVLEIKNLNASFKTSNGVTKILDGIDLNIYEGELLGLVGESGCGKSVTSLSIMGLLKQNAKIDEGEILFEKTDLTKIKEKEMRKLRGNDIAMIFQEPMTSLNPVFTIGEQLNEPLRQHSKLSKKDRREKIIEVLNLVGIPRAEKIIDEYPHQLSGGMRQRVMISLAILCQPKLLIADEPTTALDVTIQAQILELLKDIRSKTNMAILLITHDFGVVAEMCDRVVVMYTGQVVEIADVKTLFNDPKHPYTKGLLESLPSSGNRKQKLSLISGNVPTPDNLPVGCTFAPRCSMTHERCLKERPPLIHVGEQMCRCWLYHNAEEGDLNYG